MGLFGLSARLGRFILTVAVLSAPAMALAATGIDDGTAVRLPGHVLPALAGASPAVGGPDAKAVQATPAGSQTLTLTFVLKRDDEAGFRQYLHDVYDPQSPLFRHFLTQAQIADRYGPSTADYQQVLGYLRAQGFQLSAGSANRMTLTVRATRNEAEQAFAVRIGDYRLGNRTFHASDSDPALPAAIGAHVQAIAGLSDLAIPQPAVKSWPGGPFGQATWYALCADYAINGGPVNAILGSGIYTATFFDAIAFAEVIEVLSLLDAAINIAQASDLSSSGTGQQYLECVNMYNTTHGYPALGGAGPIVDGLPRPSPLAAAGAGEKVGLLEFDTFVPGDVQDYATLMGPWSGPAGNVSEVHVNGGATPGAGQSEVLLDIADVLTAAPGASIIVFDAPQTTSYQALFNAMIGQGVDVISNSWAYCEDQTTQADVASIDSILQTAAASGISVFNGAGDSGSTCLDGSPNTADVPADSPHATAVGGTSQQLYPGFTYGTETWWDGSGTTPPTGQGGFGLSKFFARPAYQSGATTASMRSIPDVSANADPRYGVVICQASAGGCPTGGFYGGTSSATPTWAAYAAVFNQVHGGRFGFLNPLLYPLAGTNAFHNAGSMGTDFAHVGLGSPDLPRLYMHLTGQTSGTVSASISTVRVSAQTTYTSPPGTSLPMLAFADGKTETFVVVTLLDAHGNPVGGKNVALTATVGGNPLFNAAEVADADSGVAIFYVKDTTPQTLLITASDVTDGIALAQTVSIEFIPPPATGGSIVAFTDAVPADGKSTDTLTVTLQDGQGRPSPGKQVTLSQTGNSVISGSSSGMTNGSGQIVFTVTDTVQEVVTYTATDVTDGDLAVPGSAVVTFNAGGGDNCGIDNLGNPDISAGPGYAIKPFATGFVPLVTNFGGLSDGCRGASGLAFDGAGNLYVSDLHTGNIYKFGVGGGVAGAGTLVTPTPLGPGLETLAFGHDGKLYGAMNATTGNAFTGAVIEINPVTGALVRTVASSITCASFLATDPASGDLFVNDSCFGDGFENGSVWRISNPGSASPATSVYASTPGINGGLSFAPGGTLYMLSYRDNAGAGGVVKITGTGSPSPGRVSVLPGITAPDLGIVAIGQQSNGDALSVILAATPGTDGFPLGIRSYDTTTSPVTTTSLLMNNAFANVQVIGPDGCMYASMNVAVYRITNADGSCPLDVTRPLLTLSPSIVSPNPTQGGTLTLNATLHNASAAAGTPIYFRINGANAQTRLASLGANGQTSFAYNGLNAGNDAIVASITVGTTVLTSNPGRVTWNPGPHATLLSLDQTPAGGEAARPIALTAALFDNTVRPPVAIAGATLQFSMDGRTCNGITNSSGVAGCSVTIPAVGAFTLTVSYAGAANYLPAVQSQIFSTTDLIFANGFEPAL